MDDRELLAAAVALAEQCPPSMTAFSVGAIIAAPDGTVLATGYSRQHDSLDHAEEAALAQVDADLAGATIYSSLEPCGRRASRPHTCAELILASPIRRVVFAMREPATFVEATGANLLRAAGCAVVELPDLADGVRRTNAHLLG
ncbi:deaminase [Labedaea rhizosphaerae]|uniref:Diaminohydroxyphosphoribosylaminopyrimidine deaminase n=1 Tax=Labedaea rhizosphaerae TaxID=598644 RepID=A0A4R6SBG9_LABRH|nr:deaminase [Labedaea rhizosphaerae]TDP97281.1 diaminohydroxyphosphoribosylaminopyrimidine deaminase [Labedaea rhizosphaerae]